MTEDIDWKTLAERSPLLGALPSRMQRNVRRKRLAPGEALFRRGDRPGSMYFVVSGEVRLVRLSRSGAEIVLQRARGGFLAEASHDNAAYHCDGVAATVVLLLVIPKPAFAQALADGRFRKLWIAHLSSEVRRLRTQSERLSLRSAKERVIHFIEVEGEDGRVALTQSKKDWARELGLTHEALYRVLGHMTRSGVLSVRGSTIRLTGGATFVGGPSG